MIPEWCKRAAEEIQTVGLVDDDGYWLESADEAIAAIVAKHAPKVQCESTADCIYEDYKDAVTRLIDLDAKNRELVEAARETLTVTGAFEEYEAGRRLLRALEPFNE